MNRSSTSEFFRALGSYKRTGIAEWEECIFTPDLEAGNLCGGASRAAVVEQHLKQLFSGGSGEKVKTFVTKKVYSRVSSIANDGPLGGCPLQLEDHFGDMSSIDYKDLSSFLNQSHLVPEMSLQKMLSILCCAFTADSSTGNPNELLDGIFPLVVFCKWTAKSHEPGGIAMITAVKSNGIFKCLIDRRVTVHGPYPATTWCADATQHSLSPSHPSHTVMAKFNNKCLLNLTKQHVSGNPTDVKPVVSRQSYAEYELLESNKPFLENSDPDVCLTYVTVAISCDKVCKILGMEEQHITDVTLKVTPLPGDMRSSAFSLYKDVQILEGFFCAFGESGEVKWTSVDDMASGENTVQKSLHMIDKIKEIIASYNQEWMLWHTERTKVTSADKTQDKNKTTNAEQTPTTKQMIFPRQELDFTERIWEILKYGVSCHELVKCFELILKEITNGNATQFWLHRNNNTTLARLIKESYVGTVTTKIDLNITNCIMLLIEIGLDKLGRDYNNFFISNRLASSHALIGYFPPDKNNCELGEEFVQVLKYRFIMLKKLHHVVELIVQCKLFLCLSDQTIFTIAKIALRDYISEELDFKRTFEFPIDYSEIESLTNGRLPSVWKLTLSSKEKNMDRTTSHCWMSEYPLKGIISPSCSDEDKTPNYPLKASTSSEFDIRNEYFLASQKSSIYSF